MSLVNDMLRDLDRRRRLPASGDSARLVYDDSDSNAGSSSKVMLGALMLCVLAVAAGAYVFINNSVPQAQPVVAVTPSPPVITETENITVGLPEQEGMAAIASTEITARVAGERRRNNGFELRFEVSEEVPFVVQSRTDNSITVLLSGVNTLTNRITSLQGVAIENTDDGLLVSLEMEKETDFVVYENAGAVTYAVVIEGFWQVMPALTSVSEQGNTVPAATEEAVADTSVPEVTVSATTAPVARPEISRTTDWVAPTRTQRELSLQERDRNASQKALQLAQNGQMQDANISLYEFVSKNPEAHQSRNTLITLLFAQQQYDQAGLLVEEGLGLAPNLSSYKKMKARLLMMNGQHDQAIQLLRNVPPVVTEDKEYYELLASLYQQTGDYMAAVSTYQELIRTDSKVGRWWAGMAISHESMGNVQDAINSFEVALQISSLESRLRQYSRNRINSLSGQ